MDCCKKIKGNQKEKGFLMGIWYGLVPHIFCLAFIVFTILGVTTVTAILRPLLFNPYFFYILIGLSFIFATILAIIYLKKSGTLSLGGIKRKRKYLSILYGTTISVNLFLFIVVFPWTANLNLKSISLVSIVNPFSEKSKIEKPQSFLTLQVEIPCPGHAPLITTELKKINGVEDVKFRFLNLFDVVYDSTKTTREQILSLEVFNTYKAAVINVNKITN